MVKKTWELRIVNSPVTGRSVTKRYASEMDARNAMEFDVYNIRDIYKRLGNIASVAYANKNDIIIGQTKITLKEVNK